MNKTIWLARLLYNHEGGLTRQEIRHKWADEDDRGRPMPESTFYDNCNYLESRYGLEVRREGGRYRLVCRSASEENVLRHLLGDMAADLGQGEAPPGSEWLPQLAEAIDAGRVLSMEYAPCGKEPYFTGFSPYFIRHIQGRAYVVGRSERHGEARTFAADRIRTLVATPQRFRRPAGLSARRWFAHSYGAWRRGRHRAGPRADRRAVGASGGVSRPAAAACLAAPAAGARSARRGVYHSS